MAYIQSRTKSVTDHSEDGIVYFVFTLAGALAGAVVGGIVGAVR